MTTPSCPHCGAQRAVPILGLADKVGSVFKSLFRGGTTMASFSNPVFVKQFEAGLIEAVCTRCGRKFRTAPGVPAAVRQAPNRSVGERLKELQELQAQGLISQDEFATQRRRILDEL